MQQTAYGEIKKILDKYEETPVTLMGRELPGIPVEGVEAMVRNPASAEQAQEQIYYYKELYERINEQYTVPFKAMFAALDEKVSPLHEFALSTRFAMAWMQGLEGGGLTVLRINNEAGKLQSVALVAVLHSVLSTESRVSILGTYGDTTGELRDTVFELAKQMKIHFGAPTMPVVEAVGFVDGELTYRISEA